MKTTQIVWNGCDGFIESDKSVFTTREEFKPFYVCEIPMSDVPRDECGEQDFDRLFVTESGRVYK